MPTVPYPWPRDPRSPRVPLQPEMLGQIVMSEDGCAWFPHQPVGRRSGWLVHQGVGIAWMAVPELGGVMVHIVGGTSPDRLDVDAVAALITPAGLADLSADLAAIADMARAGDRT